jgi:flagellin
MLQTAEGALDEVGNMLVRMKDLATQAADSSSSADDQKAMQAEYDALGKELKNVMTNTSFGGNKLMVGGTIGAGGLTFQIGASSGEQMAVDFSGGLTDIDDAIGTAAGIYSGTSGDELTTAAGAKSAIDNLTDALDKVSATRSDLGASQNRLSHVYNNLSNISTNTKAATGLIMDTDFAAESANMTSNQMLMQASTSMLKQSNSMSSMVMALLQ